MTRWILTDETPRVGRAAMLGTVTLLVLGLMLGVAVGVGLVKLVDAAHLDDIAGSFSGPASAEQPEQR